MKLPLELRRQIYGYVLPSDEMQYFGCSWLSNYGTKPGLFRINKQVYMESWPVNAEQNVACISCKELAASALRVFEKHNAFSSLRTVWLSTGPSFTQADVTRFVKKFPNITTVELTWQLVMRAKHEGHYEPSTLLKCLARMTSLKVLKPRFGSYAFAIKKARAEVLRDWLQKKTGGRVQVKTWVL